MGPTRHGDVPFFAKAIAREGRLIRLFNHGRMRRDFYAYVDDVVEAVERIIARAPAKTDAPPGGELDPASSTAPWRIYNIGNNRTVEISRGRRAFAGAGARP